MLFALLTTLVNATVAAQHQYVLFHRLVAPADRPHVVRNAVLITAAAFALSIPFAVVSANFTLALTFWLLSIPVTLVNRRMSYVQEQRQATKV